MSPVPSDRERRLALNEAAFRVANERIRNWPERRGHEKPRGTTAMRAGELSRAGAHELRRVRARAGRLDRFVVVPGHEVPDIERIVERAERYFVIEKNPEVHGITEMTDPRNDG